MELPVLTMTLENDCDMMDTDDIVTMHLGLPQPRTLHALYVHIDIVGAPT